MANKLPARLQRFPTHLKNFIQNSNQVVSLITIRKSLHKPVKGPVPQNAAVLDKSALVLLVACWERYLEELAETAFNSLLNQCVSYRDFPKKVTDLVAKSLLSRDDPNAIWELTGDGWRDVIKNYRSGIYKKTIDKFHNPQQKEIDALFFETIGYKNLTNEWRWQGLTAESACRRLSNLMARRHDIAHKVDTNYKIGLTYLNKEVNFLNSIAAISSNRVGAYITRIAGKKITIDGQEWITNVTYNSRG